MSHDVCVNIFERATHDAKFGDIDELASMFRNLILADVDYKKMLIPLLDLTTLSGNDTCAKVEQLTARAVTPVPSKLAFKCAAICVYPARVPDVIKYMKRNFIRPGWHLGVASVAGGFPSAQYLLETRLAEIRFAVRDGATEIDTVINRAAALEGRWDVVIDEVRQMKDAAGTALTEGHPGYPGKVILKVILATGELGSYENIYKAGFAAMVAGADFIKTSTGKEEVNATFESAAVMCQAIKRYHSDCGRRVGFKVAGGVRTKEDALRYYHLVEYVLGTEWLLPGLFRIGATSLLGDILAGSDESQAKR